MKNNQSLKLYIIAGEASGDLHGSNLIKAILNEAPNVDIRCWGGDKMKEAGGNVVKHIRELAFMGFIEVLMNLKTILGNIKWCKKDIEEFVPDALVLIDYPGFNLRIAEWAHKKGIKVYYYISPQVWAWKQSRVHKIKRCVDKMYVILPFEKDFYKKFEFETEFVGHPLLDAIEQYNDLNSAAGFRKAFQLDNRPIIAIVPGSRKQEVSVKLPIMLNAVKEFTDYQIIVAGAPSLDDSFYEQFIHKDTKLVSGKTYDLLSNSEVAIVTSGTATLETAMLGIPEVVCYKGSPISYRIAKALIKIRFISLVNLIMDREVVKELIQHECNAEQIKSELKKIIVGGAAREQMLADYRLLIENLGKGGASKKVAQSLLKTIHD
jgi:lipid-A-disaccharide synthase